MPGRQDALSPALKLKPLGPTCLLVICKMGRELDGMFLECSSGSVLTGCGFTGGKERRAGEESLGGNAVGDSLPLGIAWAAWEEAACGQP